MRHFFWCTTVLALISTQTAATAMTAATAKSALLSKSSSGVRSNECGQNVLGNADPE